MANGLLDRGCIVNVRDWMWRRVLKIRRTHTHIQQKKCLSKDWGPMIISKFRSIASRNIASRALPPQCDSWILNIQWHGRIQPSPPPSTTHTDRFVSISESLISHHRFSFLENENFLVLLYWTNAVECLICLDFLSRQAYGCAITVFDTGWFDAIFQWGCLSSCASFQFMISIFFCCCRFGCNSWSSWIV